MQDLRTNLFLGTNFSEPVCSQRGEPARFGRRRNPVSCAASLNRPAFLFWGQHEI